jgi:multidrug efflux pump
VDRIEKICKETPGIAHTISAAGQSFTLGAYGSNFANFFVMLDEFDKRRGPGLYSDEIIAKLRKRFAAEIPDASVLVLGPPAVNGLGTAGGFKFAVEDRGDLGMEELQQRTDALIRAANKKPTAEDPTGTPGLTGMFTVFRANSPQLFVDVNREQCFALGVQLSDVFATLQIYLGSLYVNDFNKFGRTWQVNIQADDRYRSRIEDVKKLKVRNARGGMVPLGTLCSLRLKNGPLLVGRYNMYPAAAVLGSAAPGYSSGQAVQILEDLARKELPGQTMAIEWTEITYIQITSGNTAGVLFVLAVVLVFLVLAAQYESWTLPLAVILVVPMCILGSLVGVDLSHSDVNIFTQIGFVVLVGLASKNAILIVEFARARRYAGATPADATLEACRLRLRPILMTSFAFILGVVPLMLSKGAGAEMRSVLGTAVFSGMVGVTVFGIFLTPVFFYVIDRLGEMYEQGPRWLRAILRPVGFVLYYLTVAATLGLPLLLLVLLRRRQPGGPQAGSVSVNGIGLMDQPPVLAEEEPAEPPAPQP